MKKTLKLQIQKVKNHLKQNGSYQDYKNIFAHKQMQFLLTKINHIFNDQPQASDTLDLEINLIKTFNNPNGWIEAINQLSFKWNEKWHQINWSSFGHFLYYIYHYSLYYVKKTTVEKIYTQANFIELNDQKIFYYNQWIKSMYDSHITDFNQYVIAVLRLVK